MRVSNVSCVYLLQVAVVTLDLLTRLVTLPGIARSMARSLDRLVPRIFMRLIDPFEPLRQASNRLLNQACKEFTYGQTGRWIMIRCLFLPTSIIVSGKQWSRFVSGTFENFGFAEPENPNGLSGVYVSPDSSLDRLSGPKGGYIAQGAIMMDKHITLINNFPCG